MTSTKLRRKESSLEGRGKERKRKKEERKEEGEEEVGPRFGRQGRSAFSGR